MLNIALFGPPGAGKGTQSELLVSRYDLVYISTGELLRKEMTEKTELGKEAEGIIASGGLVSDEIIVQIIEKTITENPASGGFLFDGFPRTPIQAYILDGLMLKLHTSLSCLISLEVSEELALDRLLKRGTTSGRSDDNETVIRNRLQEYKEKTVAVLEFYRSRGIVYEVDGSASVDHVTEEIATIVKKELSKELLNIVVFGYPGSGRGSQGKALAEKYGLEYMATGKMIEEEIRTGSRLGQRVTELYENGQLIPDEIVVQLIENKLSEASGVKGFIFKGFPRTLVQSYILDGLLQKHGSSTAMILDIDVPTLELIKRLDTRSKTADCMPYDKSTERIVQRLREHETKTIPVIEKYKQIHGVTRIDGMGSFEEVFERLSEAVESKLKSRQ